MTDRTMQEPWGYTNYTQSKLEREGKNVEDITSRMGTMTDEEIATELGVSVQQARDYKREYTRGAVAGQIVID